MAYYFTYIDIRIVQEHIRVLMDMFQCVQEIILYMLVCMTSVNEGNIDFRQSESFCRM